MVSVTNNGLEKEKWIRNKERAGRSWKGHEQQNGRPMSSPPHKYSWDKPTNYKYQTPNNKTAWALTASRGIWETISGAKLLCQTKLSNCETVNIPPTSLCDNANCSGLWIHPLTVYRSNKKVEMTGWTAAERVALRKQKRREARWGEEMKRETNQEDRMSESMPWKATHCLSAETERWVVSQWQKNDRENGHTV